MIPAPRTGRRGSTGSWCRERWEIQACARPAPASQGLDGLLGQEVRASGFNLQIVADFVLGQRGFPVVPG
jgi:hypothetical protein